MCHKPQLNTRFTNNEEFGEVLDKTMQGLVSYKNKYKKADRGEDQMKLTRRQVIAASAGAGAYLGFGIKALAAADGIAAQPIVKNIPGTNETLPVIGLGTNRWVAAGNKSAIDDLRATLTTFRQMNGRVIDTAPSYRTSEKALGSLINDLGIRDAFFLATKVDRTDSAAGIDRMQDSMEKLGTASVDLMQIHSLIGAESQIETLLEWKQKGLIRYAGITTSNIDQFAEMEALMRELPLDFVQLNYSLGHRQAEERLLPLAAEKKMAVMVNRPFESGRLFKAFADQELPAWAAEFDCTSWAQFFLKYVVSHPAVTCVIPGTTKEQHVRNNMGANFGRLPDAELRRQQERLFASL
jgi:diketogulonate reductase-like aldo/keto reductase